MKFSVLIPALITTMVVINGCAEPEPVTEVSYQRGPPPPYMPGHGYRHNHDNHELRFDAALNAYVLLDQRDHYYVDDKYYRYRDGNWQNSNDPDSDRWHDTEPHRVPEGLYRHYSPN